jgi:hypothetical protein
MQTRLAGRRWLYLPLMLSLAALAGALAPALARRAAERETSARVDRIAAAATAGACLPLTPVLGPAPGAAAALASWQTVGGCGAGASSSGGGGIKWIGRGVTGGLFQLQCQASYVRLGDGYVYAASTLVNADLGEKWNLGASTTWLYKYWRDPYGFGFDLSNEGWADVTALLTRRLGSLNDTSLTAMVGIPTGGYKAASKGAVLRQDKQMGHGKVTGGVILDHTFDNLWGPVVVGGTAEYRGGENELESYRGPSASAYSYAAYLLGRFAPAAGITVTGFRSEDKSEGRAQPMPLVTIAANASIEWSTDWFALLVGGSLPYDLHAFRQPWTVSMGLSLAPF